jgi:SHS family sialic acid transporter-like MFS transporter
MTDVLEPVTKDKPHEASAQALGEGGSGKVGKGAWLALAAALLGWLFDGAEMGVFSLVGRPALIDLMGTRDDKVIALWLGVITATFLVGAATGGVLFGWLGDRIGRVRAMTLSVFTYAVFTGLCGFAGEAWQVGVLRFIAALGMGGEWSLGVALVMEVWPNRSRAFMAGLIGAAANVGYLLVGCVGLILAALLTQLSTLMTQIGMSQRWVEWFITPENQGWRLIMILGTLPALLTFFIRVFVPESHKWEEEQKRGATSNWASTDLLGVLAGLAGPALIVVLWAAPLPDLIGMSAALAIRLLGTVLGLVAAIVGYMFPMLRYLQRQTTDRQGEHSLVPTLSRMLLAAALSGVALLGTWGSTQQAPAWAHKLTTEPNPQTGVVSAAKNAKEHTLIWLSVGAIVGTIGAALLGDWLGRRLTYFLLCVLSLASVYILFMANREFGPWLLFWAFVAGVFTASFYGWLPLYLPELFRTKVRATGQGFSFNFGRILAAVGVLQLGNFVGLFKDGITLGSFHLPGGLPSACSVLSLIYFVGMAIIWLAPETRGKPLPE